MPNAQRSSHLPVLSFLLGQRLFQCIELPALLGDPLPEPLKLGTEISWRRLRLRQDTEQDKSRRNRQVDGFQSADYHVAP
jgi:hypothetical protein